MTPAKLSKLVWQSVNRNRRDFLFSSIGIVIGISTLLFFTSLGAGIKETVLEKVFVVRQIEIEQKKYSGLFGAKVLDDDLVEKLKQVEGVTSVYPKMRLTFPAGAVGGKQLIGNDLRVELVADGIPDTLISKDDVRGNLEFKDWDNIACSSDSDCETGFACGEEKICKGITCDSSADLVTQRQTCGNLGFCDNSNTCAIPIPVVISPQLLEIYNGSIHTALQGSAGSMCKLPKLSESMLIGLGGDAIFGQSYFLGKAASKEKIEKKRMQLVGFSSKAINLGVTMPIGYVKRLNAKFGNKETSKNYHAIVIEASSNDQIAGIAKRVEDMGYALSSKFENAQRASLLILLITLVFNLISVIILAVAAVNIMHTFLMIILERRHEIGLMRALGATRREIMLLILSEASLLGLFGGITGALLGFGTTKAIDAVFASQVQDFPFKPDTLFAFDLWMFLMAIGAALVFCWIGALIPAIRASRTDPARALTGH